MERTVVGIDVGTSKVCTLIGEIGDSEMPRVVGVGVAASRGVRRGVIVDVEEVARAIAASVERAERVSGYPVECAYVGIAAEHISSFGSRGAVAIPKGDRGITQEDADRAMEAAQAIAIPHNREVLHVVPRGYTLDGQDGVRDPMGMLAFKLEIEVHIITGSVPPIQNLVKAVEQANVDVEDLVFGPLACSEAVLSDVEREMGVVLADVGAGTTDIAIFMDGAICHAVVLPTGGNHITSDIAIGLQMPFTAAEEAKIVYGHVLPEKEGEDEMIDVQVFGEEERQTISRSRLREIIEARAAETLSLIGREIKSSGYEGLLPAGVVLCGGSSQLRGLRELGHSILQLPVRVGSPQSLEGLLDSISDPAYATSAGLLLWGARLDALVDDDRGQAMAWQSAWARLLGWLGPFLPD